MILSIVIKLNVIDWTSIAAISTFLAVLVSLYLSKVERRERITLIDSTIGGDYYEKYGIVRTIKIQNTGHRDVLIEDLFFPKRYIIRFNTTNYY